MGELFLVFHAKIDISDPLSLPPSEVIQIIPRKVLGQNYVSPRQKEAKKVNFQSDQKFDRPHQELIMHTSNLTTQLLEKRTLSHPNLLWCLHLSLGKFEG